MPGRLWIRHEASGTRWRYQLEARPSVWSPNVQGRYAHFRYIATEIRSFAAVIRVNLVALVKNNIAIGLYPMLILSRGAPGRG